MVRQTSLCGPGSALCPAKKPVRPGNGVGLGSSEELDKGFGSGLFHL